MTFLTSWYTEDVMTAGYSGKPLSQKLGIKATSTVTLVNAPEDYGHLLFPVPEGCSIYDTLTEVSDIIQFFATDKATLEKEFPNVKSKLKPNGFLWISWPKRTAKPPIPSDLNENIIREIGLENGLVDVKVIAVDETWSGLKFVYRVKDRN